MFSLLCILSSIAVDDAILKNTANRSICEGSAELEFRAFAISASQIGPPAWKQEKLSLNGSHLMANVDWKFVGDNQQLSIISFGNKTIAPNGSITQKEEIRKDFLFNRQYFVYSEGGRNVGGSLSVRSGNEYFANSAMTGEFFGTQNFPDAFLSGAEKTLATDDRVVEGFACRRVVLEHFDGSEGEYYFDLNESHCLRCFRRVWPTFKGATPISEGLVLQTHRLRSGGVIPKRTLWYSYTSKEAERPWKLPNAKMWLQPNEKRFMAALMNAKSISDLKPKLGFDVATFTVNAPGGRRKLNGGTAKHISMDALFDGAATIALGSKVVPLEPDKASMQERIPKKSSRLVPWIVSLSVGAGVMGLAWFLLRGRRNVSMLGLVAVAVSAMGCG